MTIILVFYVIGGTIGVLIGLRFLLPTAYVDVKNAGYLGDVLKTIGYQLIRILMLSCVAFFVSWISVGYLIFHYEDFRSELEHMRRY
jgi:ammonia channel protein AmtB